MPIELICPECKAVQPRVLRVDDEEYQRGEMGEWTCVKCGHAWKPDPFHNMDLMMEREGFGYGGGDHYDKNGVPISLGEWARRMEDLQYKQVALTNFGPVIVSTVWLGMDHGWGRFLPENADVDRRPVIFETMVFFYDAKSEFGWTTDPAKHELAGEMRRWRTLEEAIAGHEEIVQMVKDNILPPEAVEWVKNVLTEINRE